MDWSALCRAIHDRDAEKTLAVHAACPPSADDHGRAIVLAAFMGDLGLVRHILTHEDSEVDLAAQYRHRARPKEKISVGAAALDMAADRGHAAVVDELLADGQIEFLGTQGYVVRPLRIADFHGHDDVVRRLLEVPAIRDAIVDYRYYMCDGLIHAWKSPRSRRHTPALQAFLHVCG